MTDLSGRGLTPEDQEQARLNREHNARIFAAAEGRTPSPTDCAGCGHAAAHHTRRDSVYAGLMADYRVVWRCAWKGCGCPEYVKPPARVVQP